MPSPFPGMDPYLENPDEWHSFHTSFIAYLADSLNQHLPQEFAAKIEERLYVVQDERDIVSDVSIRWDSPLDRSSPPAGSVVTLERELSAIEADPPQFLRVEPLTIRERYVEILAVRGKRQIVTVIEVLSPANKKGVGRPKYLRKQRELLRSGINLIEIDLLRSGTPTAAIPIIGLRFRPPFDYLVCLNRAVQRDQVSYWPFTLRDRLPRILVPLQEGFPDLTENLQATFQATYDRGAYGRLLDYREPVVPALSPDDDVWAQAILRSASLGQ